jgi:hypothetical protein
MRWFEVVKTNGYLEGSTPSSMRLHVVSACQSVYVCVYAVCMRTTCCSLDDIVIVSIFDVVFTYRTHTNQCART